MLVEEGKKKEKQNNKKNETHRLPVLHPAPLATAIKPVLRVHSQQVPPPKVDNHPCGTYSKESEPSEGHRGPWRIQARPTSGFLIGGKLYRGRRSIHQRKRRGSELLSATLVLIDSTKGTTSFGRTERTENNSVSLRQRRTTAAIKGQLEREHQCVEYEEHTTMIFRLNNEG